MGTQLHEHSNADGNQFSSILIFVVHANYQCNIFVHFYIIDHDLNIEFNVDKVTLLFDHNYLDVDSWQLNVNVGNNYQQRLKIIINNNVLFNK